MVHAIFQQIARASPILKPKLKQAGMDMKPEEFVKKTILSAFYLTFGLSFSTFLVLAKMEVLNSMLLIVPPILFLILYSYMKKLPEYRVIKKEKEISKEIIFSGRFLIVEIESGVPLYQALVNVSKNFEIIGKYVGELVDKVELGTSLEDTLNEASETIPSNNFRRILWQIMNSIRTGANVADSLKSVLSQITKEQEIEINRYGKKLNPLAMFYMILSVIIPTLGITMLIVLSSFVEITLDLDILLVFAGFSLFMQFMFVSIIKFSRPPIDF
tara:strand:- start:9497 stop:10312 length:816 start_codon:yes stop_codon:yes gene_type:complete